jgi:hypothetical protein
MLILTVEYLRKKPDIMKFMIIIEQTIENKRYLWVRRQARLHALPADPPHGRVPPVLDGVVRAARHQLRNLGPSTAELLV